MNEERHPGIERLFAAANRELEGDEFVAGVMRRTSVLNAQRLAFGLVVVVFGALFTLVAVEPLAYAVLELSQALSRPLVSSGGGIAGPTVLPINTVGGALALGAIVLRAVVRRLFSSGD
jgi:hypothetical protein